MKIREGIYISKENPDFGLFLITKSVSGWIILSCKEDGYPNSAGLVFKKKTLSKYEFVREATFKI
jgi:hypothetical protein